MNIQQISGCANAHSLPTESPTTELAANIQQLNISETNILSQNASAVQSQCHTASSSHSNRGVTALHVEKLIDIAKKWGIQNIRTVETIANRLNCTLDELTELSPENILLHQAISPHNPNKGSITQSMGEPTSRYFPNGGVPMIISLERRVINPSAKTGHIYQMCKLSDVFQAGGKITNNLVAYDSRSVVVVIPPDVSIPAETLEAYEKALHEKYEADIIDLAQKWNTQDIEGVKTIASALNICSNDIANFSNIPTEHIYFHFNMDLNRDQVVIDGNTLQCNPDNQKCGVHFQVSLEHPREFRNAITCTLSDIIQSGGGITRNRSSYDIRDVFVALPENISVPFEQAAMHR